MDRISVVGLGKLGLCFAAALAEKGFTVLGVDVEDMVVTAVNNGRTPFYEPALPDLIAKHGGKNLKATLLHRDAVETTDLTFLIVPTPSNPDGSFSNRFVESALKSLAEAFGKSGKAKHTFVISSTVMPGSCEGSFIPWIEKYSRRKFGVDFDVCFDPDFVALGNVVNGFLKPDLVVIGESCADAGARVEAIHRRLCENSPAISHMSISCAELAKVCLNAYITMKISFANTIANMCERLKGADADAITRAIGADSRISPLYFKGGLSFGGTCFPRDVRAYLTVASRLGVPGDLIEGVRRINEFQDINLLSIVLNEVKAAEAEAVGVLGVAFTANTPVITESPAVRLIRALVEKDIRVVAYDPLALDNLRLVFGSAIDYVHGPEACLDRVDVCVLPLRHDAIRSAVEGFVPCKSLTVVDCWRQIRQSCLPGSVMLVQLGRNG